MPLPTRRLLAVLALGTALVLGACSSDDDSAAPPGSDGAPSATAADTVPADEVLRIVVTNDDGVGAEGIDVLVTALEALPDVEVTVVAPAENQSGTADQTSPEPPTPTDAETASGHPAVAVPGFPADAVVAALDQGVADAPHLVVSGINEGQNIGPLSELSGTVGAARTAVRRGVPAVAVSQGFADEPDYDAAADLVVEWVEANRMALVDGTADLVVISINVPTCPDGPRDVVDVPTAADDGGVNLLEVDCASALTDPTTDVEAFVHGFATRSDVGTG